MILQDTKPTMNSTSNGQRVITLSLAEEHWTRITAALLSAAEDLAEVENPSHKKYKHTYDLVKLGLDV